MKHLFTRRSFFASSLSVAAVVVGSTVLGTAHNVFAVPNAGKILVIYYSKSGNTRAVAEMICEMTNGELYEIETVQTYPRTRPAAADIPKKEMETGKLPELKGTLPDISRYDAVIIGSPIWWYTMATPVMSFVRDIDFQGKKVAGFFTSAGDGHRFEDDLRKMATNGQVQKSIGFRGTYDTGRGPEPDGRVYQEQRRDDVCKKLGAWLAGIL